MMRIRWLIVPLALLAIGGCKWFKSPTKDNVDPPAELTDFQQTLSVRELWSRDLGDGIGKAGLRLRPAFADGRIYASDADGAIDALDAGSGAVAWRTETKTRVSSGPGLGGGLAVVGTLDGEVIALDADSGAERWRGSASSEVVAAPAIGEGVVVVRSNDGRMFGLSAEDGSRKWVFDRSMPLLTLRGNGAPIIVGDTVYAGYDNGKIVALRLEDGQAKWEETLAQAEGRTELDRMVDVDGELGFGDERLFGATFNGQIGALAIDSGRQLWSREMSAYGGLAVSGNSVYIADTDGTLWALDSGTGTTQWKQVGLAHRYLSAPAVVGDYVVVGDFEGFIHWYKTSTGDLVARSRLGSKGIKAAPLVVGDTVYVASADGDIAAFQPAGG